MLQHQIGMREAANVFETIEPLTGQGSLFEIFEIFEILTRKHLIDTNSYAFMGNTKDAIMRMISKNI